MPLLYGKPGKQYEIVSLFGGRGFSRKLFEMGIRPGVIIKVITNSGNGPILVGINNSRIGLGKGMAGKIIINSISIKEAKAI
ncbi:MAG: FeoA domain-containing protein [Spirochaetales bacterium]|nr:FeoA domain-containing protein [Spirochaetales bacterium]